MFCALFALQDIKNVVLRRVLPVFVELCLLCKQSNGCMRHDVKNVVLPGFFACFAPCLLCKQRHIYKNRCFALCFCHFILQSNIYIYIYIYRTNIIAKHDI